MHKTLFIVTTAILLIAWFMTNGEYDYFAHQFNINQ